MHVRKVHAVSHMTFTLTPESSGHAKCVGALGVVGPAAVRDNVTGAVVGEVFGELRTIGRLFRGGALAGTLFCVADDWRDPIPERKPAL